MIVSDQNVIVTGGASGLGLTFARCLARLGAQVWALDRDRDALARCGPSSGNGREGPEFVFCDVSRESEVIETVGWIEQRCRQGSASGGIDVLVNNAAVLIDQTLVSKLGRKMKKHSLADWQETLACNLTGAFLMAREVAEAIIRRKARGLIVNVSSISRHGNPGQSAYAASKAGIDALTVTWSQELAPYGIRVVAIAPGFVETPMTENIPPLFLDRIKQETPLKRFGTLEEFAHTIRYVIENDYLNGKTLELDGGLRF
jgi:3-oxoacyl-[acyl-carrier protein] reductase